MAFVLAIVAVSDTLRKLRIVVEKQANVVAVLQGGAVKLSSPSLRPRLYLNPGDKGYVGGSSAKRNEGGGKGRHETGYFEGADTLADCERQVRVSLSTKKGRREGVKW